VRRSGSPGPEPTRVIRGLAVLGKIGVVLVVDGSDDVGEGDLLLLLLLGSMPESSLMYSRRRVVVIRFVSDGCMCRCCGGSGVMNDNIGDGDRIRR